MSQDNPYSQRSIIGALRRSKVVGEGMAQLASPADLALALLLERTLPRELTEQDRPALGEHVLIWRKGAEHWTLATANTNENYTGTRPLGLYFLLANTGDVRLQPEEITYWMPQPPSPRYG